MLSHPGTINVLLFALGFFAGALPFSLWIGQYFLGEDIRSVGDANPGATNVYLVGGRTAAALALVLDFMKGALPVGLAYHVLGIAGWALVPIAVSPVLGHAFSPFLRGRGGKAVAATGGIWSGLTAWEGPVIGGLVLGIAAYLFGTNGWAVVVAMISIAAYVTIAPPSWNPWFTRPDDVVLLAVAAANLLIVSWKHRADLRYPPRLRQFSWPLG